MLKALIGWSLLFTVILWMLPKGPGYSDSQEIGFGIFFGTIFGIIVVCLFY